MKTFVTVILSALVGGGIVFAALKADPSLVVSQKEETKGTNEEVIDDIMESHRQMTKQFNSLFDDDFFSQKDPFEEMRKMRKRMREQDSLFSAPFDSWFSGRFGGGNVDEIHSHEDDQYIYYEIKVEDLESTSINAKVEQGYITITGTTKKGDENSHFSSSFQRSFPVPYGVDENKMEMSSEEDKVIIKFPKGETI